MPNNIFTWQMGARRLGETTTIYKSGYQGKGASKLPKHKTMKACHAFVSKALPIFLAPGIILSVSGASNLAQATPLSVISFNVLAAKCASPVSPQMLKAVAQTESDLDPLALHDNTTGDSARPSNTGDAVQTANLWISHGDSVDLGLMQINSANLSALDMTVPAAFSPCLSLAAGADILHAAYGNRSIESNDQVALLLALSRYNTGTPLKGIVNGYAAKVLANLNDQSYDPVQEGNPSDLVGQSDTPPAWNVSAIANDAQTHGASWLIVFVPRHDVITRPDTVKDSNATISTDRSTP